MPLGCGAEMQWDLLKGHVRESCPQTLFYCKHGFCFETLNRDSIARHESICGEVMVKCECGKDVRRKDKEAHEQADRNGVQPWILKSLKLGRSLLLKFPDFRILEI